MRIDRLRVSLLLCALCLSSVAFASNAAAQERVLRHHLPTGLKAQCLTEVKMSGNSLLLGEQRPTDLTMKMLRSLQSTGADSGASELRIQVERLITEGNIGDESFNQTLTGETLNEVMFGQTEANVRVTPMGGIRGTGGFSMESLGIGMPGGGMSARGGFEFPTFPAEPVRVGDTWDENGQLLNRRSFGDNNSSQGQRVYRLQRFINTPHGPAAVIEYRKTTQMSGMGLGNLGMTQSGVSQSASANVQGLRIHLEGRIYFNIERGVVTRSVQQGRWNLDMDTASPDHRQPQRLNQGMSIEIESNFNWDATEVRREDLP